MVRPGSDVNGRTSVRTQEQVGHGVDGLGVWQTPRPLQQAFNVKTVGDLGRNKFFRAAQALALLAESTGKK